MFTAPVSPHDRVHYRPEVSRFVVVGDVHGCYDELAELLALVEMEHLLDPDIAAAPAWQPPRLVFVGDIVDRGDRSIDALRLVMRLWQRGHALAVLGNHDDRFARWLEGGDVALTHGLADTVAQLEAVPAEEREELQREMLEYFARAPWALRLDAGRVTVAHAAWHPTLHSEWVGRRLRGYTLYGPTTGRRSAEGFPERIDWARSYPGPDFVVFGHQVYQHPYRTAHAIGIDTGCVYGGELTAFRWPEMTTVSVPSHRARAIYRSAGLPWKL